MVVQVLTPVVSHHAPTGRFGSMAAASAMAPAAFTAPAPWVSVSAFATRIAVYCKMALTACGGSCAPGWLVRLASNMAATIPLTTGADMLVPLRRRNGLPFTDTT